jgi:hypothetical protein
MRILPFVPGFGGPVQIFCTYLRTNSRRNKAFYTPRCSFTKALIHQANRLNYEEPHSVPAGCWQVSALHLSRATMKHVSLYLLLRMEEVVQYKLSGLSHGHDVREATSFWRSGFVASPRQPLGTNGDQMERSLPCFDGHHDDCLEWQNRRPACWHLPRHAARVGPVLDLLNFDFT